MLVNGTLTARRAVNSTLLLNGLLTMLVMLQCVKYELPFALRDVVDSYRTALYSVFLL